MDDSPYISWDGVRPTLKNGIFTTAWITYINYQPHHISAKSTGAFNFWWNFCPTQPPFFIIVSLPDRGCDAKTRGMLLSQLFQFSQYGNDRKIFSYLGSFTFLLSVWGKFNLFDEMMHLIFWWNDSNLTKKARLQGFICQIRILKVCTRDWELVPERFHAAWWRCASSECRKASKEATYTEVSTGTHNVCLESKIQYRIEFSVQWMFILFTSDFFWWQGPYDGFVNFYEGRSDWLGASCFPWDVVMLCMVEVQSGSRGRTLCPSLCSRKECPTFSFLDVVSVWWYLPDACVIQL